MPFDEWYDINKKALSSLSLVEKLKQAWIASRLKGAQ